MSNYAAHRRRRCGAKTIAQITMKPGIIIGRPWNYPSGGRAHRRIHCRGGIPDIPSFERRDAMSRFARRNLPALFVVVVLALVPVSAAQARPFSHTNSTDV